MLRVVGGVCMRRTVMHVVMPSGFSIVPYGGPAAGQKMGGGSLLTVAIQILVNTLPSAKLTVKNILISDLQEATCACLNPWIGH